jgi:WD40 repeat protein
VEERQLISQISISDDVAVLKVHFSPQGDVLAAGNARGEIKIFNVETSDPIERTLKLPDGGVSDLAYSSDGSRLTAISEAGTIRSWDTADGSLVSEMQVALDPERTFVAISPEAGVVGSGFSDGEIQLISLDSGRELGPSIIHATPFLGIVTTVAYSPDGKIVATAGADGAIVLWDSESLQPIDDPMFGHNAIVVSLAFSPDGRTLASGSCGEFNSSGNCIGGEVLLWDVVSGQQLHRFSDSVGFVQALAFSPDGKMLVTNDCSRVEVAGACIEGTLRLWDVNSGRIIERDFEGHTGFIWSATFSPDGKILASGSNDNSVILWDVATGEQIGQRLSNHGGPVRRVAFSPDGTRLASAGFDNLVFLWNVESGQAIGGPVAVFTNNALDVAFNGEGTILASSGADGTVILTDVDLESWRVLACRIANRNMRQAEWELFFGEVPFQETCPSD